MRSIIAAVSVLLPVLAVACADDSGLQPDADRVVVGAYLFAGEPVEEIKLTAALPLGSEDSTAAPINDAQVRLIKDGAVYPLQPSPGDSGYYRYDGDDLTISAGDKFRIEVEYFGRTASGETVVPSPPEEVAVSGDTLVIPDRSGFIPGGGGFNPGDFDFEDMFGRSLYVTWDNDGGDLYFVTVKCVEADPESISTGFLGRGGMFRSSPTSRDSFTISQQQVTFLGRHQVRVYRVNQEYADLYISRRQDSRDLNEPLSNITDGLGVFSAFNSRSAFIEVVRE